MADSGWYPDSSTPGYERYWDGQAWTSQTRPAGQPAAPQYPAPAYGAPSPAAPGAPAYSAPAYSAPAYSAPAGAYAQYGPGLGVPRNAEIGPRLLAYLIDTGITLGVMLAALIPGFLVSLLISVSDAFGYLAVLLLVLGYLGAIGFSLHNLVVRQGRTGQTIGKQRMNIKLVGESTGVPLGIGGAVIRWILPAALGALTCGIVSTLDVLWPLWDPNNQRLVDKWMHYSVVPVAPEAAPGR